MRALMFGLLIVAGTSAWANESIVPAGFEFGESPGAHEAFLAGACDTTTERTLDPAESPLANESLVQIDCEGFAFRGADRLAEFVFADGGLTHVWILTDREEEPAMRADFEAAFGAPSHEADLFFAFTQSHVAIRRDVPEVLFYGEPKAPFFAAWFDQAAQ